MSIFGHNRYGFIVRSADVEGSGGSEEDTGTPTPATDDKGASGGTKAPDPATDVKAMIAQEVANAVAGLKKKNDELLGSLKKTKEALDAAKAQPTLTEDEFKRYAELKEKLERDELLAAMADGKTEEVIDKVTRKTRMEADAKLAAEVEARTKAQEAAAEATRKYDDTLISVEITKAAAPHVKPAYSELVTDMVRKNVKLIDGVARVVNSDGEIEMTANGAAPLSLNDYIEGLRNKYADLFLASSGGGAGGSGTPAGGRQATSTKVASEVAGSMTMEQYMAARKSGNI